MVLKQELRQPLVISVRLPYPDQAEQFVGEAARHHQQTVLGNITAHKAIPQCQPTLQQIFDVGRKPRSAARRRLQHFVAAVDQMGVALLVNGLRETVVGRPAVMHQLSAPVLAQKLHRRLTAARRIEDIGDGVQTSKLMQPSLRSPDSPAGFIGNDLRRPADILPNLLMGRRTTPGGPVARTGGSRAADGDSEEFAEGLLDLSMRKPQPFVEPGERRMSPRAELDSGRSCRVGSLQLMPATNRLSAFLAAPCLDRELAINGSLRDLDLILHNGLAKSTSVHSQHAHASGRGTS